MNIAIHTTELTQSRIDGTRVYLSALLQRFYCIAPEEHFYLFHHMPLRDVYHVPRVAPYHDVALPQAPAWTQTVFASALMRRPIDVLWMPLHNLPRLRRSNLKTVVTIHDVAFKDYPEMFPWRDRLALKMQTDYALGHATHIIAVSQKTKDDICAYYPQRDPASVHVIHHGYDAYTCKQNHNDEEQNVHRRYGVRGDYIIYTGAIQPRKNIIVLIKAFEKLKKSHPQLQLVLAGADAWMASGIHDRVRRSPVKDAIIFTGGVSDTEYKALLCGARVGVHPGIAEGFGLTVLDAFAAGVPIICARSGSLPEIAGDAAWYFPPDDAMVLADQLERLLQEPSCATDLVGRGRRQLQKYSWDRCAQETLQVLLNA